MAIGEFGGAATLPGDGGTVLATPMYWFYEMGHAALNPSRAFADATRLFFKNPANPHGLVGSCLSRAPWLVTLAARSCRWATRSAVPSSGLGSISSLCGL